MLTLCGASAKQTGLPPLAMDVAVGLLGHFASAATCREEKRASKGSAFAYMSKCVGFSHFPLRGFASKGTQHLRSPSALHRASKRIGSERDVLPAVRTL